tara:strand:+ start:1201 stop:1845 length:645 start_codon:yes stop_codon:yes gene_type:complete
MAEIQVTTRENSGTSHSKRMRREGQVPAIIYGTKEPINVQLVHKDILKTLKETNSGAIHTLKWDNNEIDAIIKEVQYHPWKDQVLHLDFKTVKTNEKFKANIQIEIINEENCVGLKAGGRLIRQQETLEIISLPKHIPETIQIDISELEIGHAKHISDVELPAKVELAQEITETNNHPLVSIIAPRAEAKIADEDETDADADANEAKSENDTEA